MSPIATLFLLTIPLLANATDKHYPPEEYYLVKGKCVGYGSRRHDCTLKVIDVLSGPKNLKGEYFLAIFFDSDRFRHVRDRGGLLRNNTTIEFGDESYHWVVVYRDDEGQPVRKTLRLGAFEFDSAPDSTKSSFPSTHRVESNLVSLSMTVGRGAYTRSLKKIIPSPTRFPMTSDKLIFGPVWSGPPNAQELVDKDVREGVWPNISPPSKEVAEEWMAGMKEFCGTQEPEKREQLLEKYKASKNVYLAEWARFVEKEYGNRTVPPKYDE